MKASHLHKAKKHGAGIFSFLIAAVLTVLVLLLVSGYGAKKRVPEEVGKLEPDRQIELEPGQQRIADWHALLLQSGLTSFLSTALTARDYGWQKSIARIDWEGLNA